MNTSLEKLDQSLEQFFGLALSTKSYLMESDYKCKTLLLKTLNPLWANFY